MKVKKLAVALTAILLAFSAVGCGGGSNGGGALKIKILNYGGGVGSIWLDDAIERFKKEVGDKQYGNYKGVDIKYTPTQDMGLSEIATSGTHMYFTEGTSTIRTMIQNGELMDITDVVEGVGTDGKTILSKIDDSYHVMLKGPKDKYYALPHYEFYSGISYDIELFDANGYYFAAPSETDVAPYTSTKGFGSANFVGSVDATKSCGPNGKSGDYDDGLPSSVQELLLLCEKMAGDTVTPILYATGDESYSNKIATALWASLSGYKEMEAYHSYDDKVMVVDGYEETNLFNSDIPAPKMREVLLTEETGYYASQQVARYYTLAFMEIAFKNGYFESVEVYSNTGAQSDFISNGIGNNDTYGMLIEGNYWINEASDDELFDDYYKSIRYEKDYRHIGWMPLPVQWAGSVTEGNGATPTMVDVAASYVFINNRFAKNAAISEACKDFLKFLYTDAELSHFTGTTGIAKSALQYALEKADKDKLSAFESSVLSMKSEGGIIYATADNPTFLGAYQQLRMGGNSPLLKPAFGGKSYNTVLEAMRIGKSAKEIFEGTLLNATQWLDFYKG